MMDARLVTISSALAAALTAKDASGTPFSQRVKANFTFLPQYEPADLVKPTLTILPRTKSCEVVSRDHKQSTTYTVDVALQAKLDAFKDRDTQIKAWLALHEEIADFIAALEVDPNIAWTGDDNVTPFLIDHLLKGIFTGVLTVTYKEVR
ncbi:MAG: hypothetical protein WCI73_15720 [Phycisphaerae bacterium]